MDVAATSKHKKYINFLWFYYSELEEGFPGKFAISVVCYMVFWTHKGWIDEMTLFIANGVCFLQFSIKCFTFVIVDIIVSNAFFRLLSMSSQNEEFFVRSTSMCDHTSVHHLCYSPVFLYVVLQVFQARVSYRSWSVVGKTSGLRKHAAQTGKRWNVTRRHHTARPEWVKIKTFLCWFQWADYEYFWIGLDPRKHKIVRKSL